MSRRILIVEDEPGLVLSLEDRLMSEGYKVNAVGDGIEGQNEGSSEAYDLIILDVMLPGRDGFQVCQNLRSSGVQTPILMLTARDTTIDTVMGLRIGADDYLAKPFDMQVLLARIHALLRRTERGSGASSERAAVHRFGLFVLDSSAYQLTNGTAEIPLNAQEFRLLEVLVKNPNRVLSREFLLDEAWGYDTETTTRTVDTHVAWLRQKLGEKELPRHLITVRGYGYMFQPEP